jgi:hypothetical protein
VVWIAFRQSHYTILKLMLETVSSKYMPAMGAYSRMSVSSRACLTMVLPRGLATFGIHLQHRRFFHLIHNIVRSQLVSAPLTYDKHNMNIVQSSAI